MGQTSDFIVNVIYPLLLGSDYELFRSTMIKIKKQKEYQKNPEALSLKISELSDSLKKSSELMSDIEVEFIKQKEFTKRLKEEAETSQLIASLNREEVDAVNRIFSSTVKKEGRKSSNISVAWNAFFCLIGLVGGYFITKYLL